jgi:hypothetical protein
MENLVGSYSKAFFPEEVPYLADEEYDNEGFYDYPERRGYYLTRKSIQRMDPHEFATLIQASSIVRISRTSH